MGGGGCLAATAKVSCLRQKYIACVSKLVELSEEYLGPQKTQKAAVFFYYSEDLGQENDSKS
jgi:hypothetical protein